MQRRPGPGIGELVLEIFRRAHFDNPDRKLTVNEIAYRIYGDRWEKELEISIEKNVLRRLEDNGVLKSDRDPHSGRRLYSLNMTTEETKSVDLDQVFSD